MSADTPAGAPPVNSLSDPRVDVLQAQVQQMSQQVQLLTQLILNGQTPGAVTAPAAFPPQQPAPAAQPSQNPADYGFTEPTYFVRIKPFNKKRGQLRRRQYFDEIGRAINGGDGSPGNVPDWVEVTAAQAMQMSKYRQDDNNPASQRVLDICTAEERISIDQAEAQMRAGQLGLLGMTPQAIMDAAHKAGTVAARVGSTISQRDQTPVREAPSIIAGAELHVGQPAIGQDGLPLPVPAAQPAGVLQPPPQQPQPQAVVPAEAAGRMAALADVPADVPAPPPTMDMSPPAQAPEGLPPLPAAPPPPVIKSNRGVSEDLTAEAARDDSAAAALKAAEAYPTHGTGLAPK